jgi:endo-1,4-beta-xylanase
LLRGFLGEKGLYGYGARSEKKDFAMCGKMKFRFLTAAAGVFLMLFASQAELLTAAEILKIETDLNVTLSSNEVVQLSAIVLPTNMPTWRVDAYDRIDTHRKANLDIQVVDMNGDPVEGAQVAVQLRNNDFKFGGVFSLKDFTDENNNLSNNGFSAQEYQDLFLKMFNSVGLDNGFKPKQRAGNEDLLPGFISWAQSNELPVRGHTLIWPGTPSNNHLPTELPDTATSYSVLSKVEAVDDAQTNNPAAVPALKADLKSEVDYMIGDWASKWSVYEWDVINETLSNHRVQDLLGNEETAVWFDVAEANVVDPDCKLLINEYQIISARSESLNPGNYDARKAEYMTNINYVIDNGGRLDRIGFQSRVKFEVPSPQTWYDRLEEFAVAYGLPMVGTEFEVRDTENNPLWYPYDYTEEERAQVTEELLTAYFSHPLTTGLNAWTYMKGFDRVYSMCYYDGTVKLNGLAWYYLHRIRYNTDVMLASGLNGKTGLRAFKGDYDLTVSYNGLDYASTLTLTNDDSIVIMLTLSIAEDPNTSEVVDAWQYDSLSNGAGLAEGVSTGLVGGVFFNNNDLAAIQEGTVRWQSDGVSDSMYAGKDLSSSDGAGNGFFQLSVDYLDGDFTATAALTNGTGRVGYAFRNDPAGTKEDAGFRLVFFSGGGSNAFYRLEVTDALGNNQHAGTFPGTTLEHLNVRAVYDLDNSGSLGSFKVYYRLDGGSEVAAYTGGQLVSGFALDQLRNVVQTFDGSANWAAGDKISTDNLIVRTLGAPPPPPSEIVVDEWDYEGLTNAGLIEALSSGVVGNASFANVDLVSITDGVQNWTRFDAGNTSESAFRTTDPSSYDASTSGMFQVSWDFVSADFVNTDTADTSANIGFGLRSKNNGNEDVAFRFRYDGTANQFLVQLTDANGANQTFPASAISGNSLSNLNVRMIVDLDNRGSAGSVKLYYTPDDGSEVVLTEAGMASATFQMDQYRYAVQTSNGGTDWQVGDVVTTDNLVVSLLMESAATPSALLDDWLADYPTLGSQTNLTDNPDADLADNLLEYAFGGDPTNAFDIGYWPEFQSLEDGGTNYIEYVYARRNDAAARGLSYELENTADLIEGVWTNSGFLFVGEGPIDGEFDAITNRLPITGVEGFIRLNIHYTP